jgi:hypothetical protein
MPEEVDAVQVFARRLVEDFGYATEQIRMHQPGRHGPPEVVLRWRPS